MNVTIGALVVMAILAINAASLANGACNKFVDPPCGTNKLFKLHQTIDTTDTLLNEHPWLVRLEHAYRPHCNAIIIGKRHLLTASACLVNKEGGLSRFKVIVGDYDSSDDDDGGRELPIESVHPNKTSGLGLIRMQDDFKFKLDPNDGCGPVNKICLPDADDGGLTEDDKIIYVGWFGHESSNPQTVEVARVAKKKCEKANDYMMGADQLCVAGHYAMPGFYGGSFVRRRTSDGRYELIGLATTGTINPKYGVITRYDHHAEWINQAIDC